MKKDNLQKYFLILFFLQMVNSSLEDEYTNNISMVTPKMTLFWKPVLDTDEYIYLALRGTGVSGWVGLGINTQLVMIGSQSVVGWIDASDGNSTVSAYNMGGKAAEYFSAAPDLNISETSMTYADGDLTMYFKMKFGAGEYPFSQSADNPIFATYGTSPALVQHAIPPVALVSVNFETGSSSVDDAPATTDSVHAILMLIAWGFCFPLGMIFARYTRKFPNALWFQSHRVLQSLGYVIALISFIIILIPRGPVTTVYHGQLGITIMVLLTIQMVFGILRPEKTAGTIPSDSRKVFEYFHWWVGRGLLILSVINIYAGFIEIGDSFDVGRIIYSVFLAVVVVGILVVEIYNCVSPSEHITPCFKTYSDKDS